jgi:hypothetical protein
VKIKKIMLINVSKTLFKEAKASMGKEGRSPMVGELSEPLDE